MDYILMLLINYTKVGNTHLNRSRALFQLLHECNKQSLSSYATNPWIQVKQQL